LELVLFLGIRLFWEGYRVCVWIVFGEEGNRWLVAFRVGSGY
jgi:hypothetical protein